MNVLTTMVGCLLLFVAWGESDGNFSSRTFTNKKEALKYFRQKGIIPQRKTFMWMEIITDVNDVRTFNSWEKAIEYFKEDRRTK